MPRLPMPLLLLLAWSAGLIAQDPWQQDFAAASAAANTANKGLLLLFTGSDWCAPCQQLERQVLSKPEFVQAAAAHFVLVKLDFPRDAAQLPPERRRQNEALQERYGIQGYPTVLLLDRSGVAYAETGYRDGGARDYVAHLDDLRRRGAAWADALQRAQGMSGTTRARCLHEALAALDPAVVARFHLATAREIVALDADGQAGLKNRYEELLQEAEAKPKLAALQKEVNQLFRRRDHTAVIRRLDEVLAQERQAKSVRQWATYYKGIAVMETSGSLDEAMRLLRQAQAIAPDTELGRSVDAAIDSLKKQAAEKGDGRR